VPVLVDSELRLSLSATEAVIPAVAEDMGNPAWDEAAARILVLRLSPFGDVAGSSSHLLVFAECRRAVPGAFVDFGFFPDARDRSILGARKLSYFYGLQSGRGPADFDLVMVSNAFSLELLNLSYLYSGSSLPRRASERAAFGEGRAPIVILGGSNAAAAGALLYPGARSEEASDCLVDGIFFGEGEGAIGELATALTLPGAPRAERLERASSIGGFWAALSGRAAARKILLPYPPRLSGYPVLNSEGADTARLQISAGCPGFCSFCLEGWAFRPYREKPVDEIVEAARELKSRTGASRLDVYSYNFNAHSGVFGLMLGLSRVFRRVDFMSQRLDILSESSALAGAELAADKRSFTLGVEGISERMRRYYRKGIDASQIDAALDRLALPAARELKLFYIIAGIEDDRDLAEFADFAARAAQRRLREAPGQRIIVSAGYLARLPFTPLQYAALCLDRDRLESIARRMEGACSASGIEFRLSSDFEEYYADQLISLGGRALAPWLEKTPEAGLLYDGRLSRGAGASLEQYAGAAGLLDEAFLGEKGEDWRPPLAFIDGNGAALRKNYHLASSFALREGRIPLPKPPDADWARRLERLMAAKRDFGSALVAVELPRTLAWATAEYRSSWIMRAISAASPEGGASVFDAEEALFAKGTRLEGMADRFWGLAYYRLRGPAPPRMARAASAAGFAPVEALPACESVSVSAEVPAAHAREAEEALKSWLAAERISFIEEKVGASRRLRPSARDARKRILVEALLVGHESSAGGAFEARLELGPKARLEDWRSRMGSAAARSVSIRFLRF
jgi:radical SAM superfamily enzyme YgiQ (UPF0313 family)